MVYMYLGVLRINCQKYYHLLVPQGGLYGQRSHRKLKKKIEKGIKIQKMPNYTDKNKSCKMHNNYRECISTMNTEWSREDNSLLKQTTKDLCASTKCDILLVKKLIVRLRRAMPENTIMNGYSLNAHSHEDFNKLKKIIEKKIDDYLAVLDNRWLISILDTYNDWGDIHESKNAMIVTTFINMERISCTEKLQIRKMTYPFRIKNPHKRQKNLWSGLKTTNLKADDFYCNFLYRITHTLTDTPVIFKIFQHLFNDAKKNKYSSFNAICKHSDWIKNILS